MLRLSAAVLLVLAIFIPTPRRMDTGISSIVAGPRSALTLSLPYRLVAPQANWDLEMSAVNRVNQARVAVGLVALIPHATIRSAARAHGIEMFTFGYLSHRSLDGRSPDERVKRLGVRVTLVGENLAYAQDVRESHHALMSSASHRANILSTRYRRFGVGVIDGGSFGVIVVQDFSD
jgi:uncharacterized protein YkwD